MPAEDDNLKQEARDIQTNLGSIQTNPGAIDDTGVKIDRENYKET